MYVILKLENIHPCKTEKAFLIAEVIDERPPITPLVEVGDLWADLVTLITREENSCDLRKFPVKNSCENKIMSHPGKRNTCE